MRKPANTFVLLMIVFLLSNLASAQKIKAEDVIAKHLDSIGTAQAREAAKTLLIVGNGTSKFTSTKDITLQGKIVLASEGVNNFLGMNMNSPLYSGEKFAYNGKDVFVGFATVSVRSVLGNFVQSNTGIVSEGLVGGTLSTSWALERLASNKAKVSSNGIKKIDGKELYAISYSKKGGSDLDITLYFDKDTFRHVRTEYKRVASVGIGVGLSDSARANEIRYSFVEEFGDFKAEAGLSLPHTYRMVYSATGTQGTTGIEWNFVLSDFTRNQKLESSTFSAV